MADHPARVKEPLRFRLLRQGTRSLKRTKKKSRIQEIPFKKWFALIFLVIIPALVVTVFLIKRTHTNYYLVTGPIGGVDDSIGTPMIAVLNEPDELEKMLHLNIIPDFTVRESCGGLDNIYSLNHGLAQLGFAQDGLPMHFRQPFYCTISGNRIDVIKEGQYDKTRVKALMPLYKAPLHIVVRKDLAIADVREIAPHTKVFIGPEGSATAYVADLILSHFRIPIERVGQDLNFQQAIQEMRQGKFKVGFFLSGLYAKEIQSLAEHDDFKLLTIENASSLNLLFPFLEMLTIPATTYKGILKDIPTLGTKTILAVSTDLSDAEVYEIATKLSNHIRDIIKDIPFNATKVTESDPQKDLYYPLHPGAIRFYNHNPPFFLDPHKLAGIGTYLSLLFAFYKVSKQYQRNYIVNRFMHSIDRAMMVYKMHSRQPLSERYEWTMQKLKLKAITLLRHHKITTDDIHRIDEYGSAPLKTGHS